MLRITKMSGVWYAYEISDHLTSKEVADIRDLVETDCPTLLAVDLESAQDALPDETIKVVEPE